jgi:signal transduction histidine kinase
MDREIPKEIRQKERNKKLLKYGGIASAVVACLALLISFMQSSVKLKDLVLSTVDNGLIEVSVSASGKVVPAFEEIINSPINTRIVEVYRKGGDSVDVGTPILKLDLQSTETEYKKLLDERISMVNKAVLAFLDEKTEEDLLDKTMDMLNGSLAEELTRLPKDTTTTIRLSDSHIYRCSHLSFIDRGFAHPFYLIESLTSEVMKAEKKAYEKVIRMIAHEVNNSVAGITSTLDTIDDALQTMDDTEDIREVMRVCVERSYSMSRFITNFADVVKIPEPQLEEVHLNDRVVACKIFMENLCQHRDIDLQLDLCEENPLVSMDTSLFEQVIINIIKNATESIDTHGKVIIRTSSAPLMLEIGDTGRGISKEVESKLFSPFFSTKPNGQGIGLIFIREVLMKHGCTFSLRTYPDGITRFKIFF